MRPATRILYIYAAEDAPLRRALEAQLAVFRREGHLVEWGEAWLVAGDTVRDEVDRHLREADLLVPLVSPALFSSDQDYHLLQEALRRHDDQGTPLVPVIVRPALWQVTPLGGLSVLPPTGKPITTWPNVDEAWLAVVEGLRAHLLAEASGAGPALAAANPYRGLSAFQEEDHHLFFGREELTRHLWRTFSRLHMRTDGARLLTVHGPSGSGKSSVVRAGLVPALKNQPVQGQAPPRIVVFTPGVRPVEQLARSLDGLLPQEPGHLPAVRVRQLEDDLLRRPSAAGVYDGLRRFAADLPDIGPAALVLVVDVTSWGVVGGKKEVSVL